MGWSTGLQVAECVWQDVEGFILPGFKKAVAERLRETFEEYDCDEIAEANFLQPCPYCGKVQCEESHDGN